MVLHNVNQIIQFLCIVKDIILLLVYADDIALTGNNESFISALKAYLQQSFNIKDLDLLHYFLEIEVVQSSKDLFFLDGNIVLIFFMMLDILDARVRDTV